MPFSQGTLDFLAENRIRDSRTWFHEHNEEYRTLVIRPLQELTEALTPLMLDFDSEFVTEPRVDKTISRIWRDTRYTRDPSLYRENMWIVFKRDRMHTTDYPGFYFDISPDGFSYGCGFYHASTGYMETLRKLVLERHPTFRKAQSAFAAQSVFRMDGECYKRPRYAAYPEAQRQWLERRNISFNADSHDFKLLFSPQLGVVLTDHLSKLKHIYRFLLEAAIRESAREAGRQSEQRFG